MWTWVNQHRQDSHAWVEEGMLSLVELSMHGLLASCSDPLGLPLVEVVQNEWGFWTRWRDGAEVPRVVEEGPDAVPRL